MRLFIASLIMFGLIPAGVHAKPVEYISSGSSWRYTRKDIPSEQAAAVKLNDSHWLIGHSPFSSVKSGPFAMRTNWPANTSIWVRKHVIIKYPSELKAYMAVDNGYEFYWNGVLINKGYDKPSAKWRYVFTIPAPAVRKGRNLIAIRLIDRGGTAAFDMKLVKSTGIVSEQGVIYNPDNQHYYRIVTTPHGLSWDDANTLALQTRYRNLQGHLATINTAKENAFLLQHLPGNACPFWLGGFQPDGSREPDGGWRWVTPEKWSYTNWAPREPSNGDNHENMLEFRPDGLWNDQYEGTNLQIGYIVEFEPGRY
ncbi:MAG: C-type lectin domain-containing protein [Armatimonadota bacterium]